MRIIVSGGWSYHNVGDEVIASVTFDLIRKYFPSAEMTVLAYDPVEFKKHHPETVEKALHTAVEEDAIDTVEKYEKILSNPLDGAYREYAEFFDEDSVFIMSGGGYFIERWTTSFYAHLLEIEIAKQRGAKVFVIAQSIGPVLTDAGRKAMSQAFSRCEYISVRDKKSINHLKEFVTGIEIHLVADLVNVISDFFPAQKTNEPKIGIVATYAPDYLDQKAKRKPIWEYNALTNRIVKKMQYISYCINFLNVCKWIQQRTGKKISFIASTDFDWDHAFVQWVTDRLPAGSFEIHQNMDEVELCSQLTQVQYLFSTKMHPMIIASSYGIPGAALSYNYKLDDYMDSIGRGAQCLKNTSFTSAAMIDILEKDIGINSGIDVGNLKQQVYDMFSEMARRAGYDREVRV